MNAPRIGITLGDPAGIGPEVVAKALARESLHGQAELLPIGPPSVLAHWGLDGPRAIHTSDLEWARVRPGEISADCGRVALEAVRLGVERCLAGALDALVTGPIHKRAAQLAGLEFPGHTEFIAALCGNPEVRMLLAGERLRTIHVTTHMALNEACHQATAARVWRTIELGHQAMRLLGYEQPRIAVAGLNPHAGEEGLFGDEDRQQIAPAVEQARRRGLAVHGPLPPDTIFLRAWQGEFDLVVAMYHDQGHIPMKLVEFDKTVNITVGLPILRTSVDHGTAFDIAGQNRARPENMVRAIEVAIQLASRRKSAGGPDRGVPSGAGLAAHPAGPDYS